MAAAVGSKEDQALQPPRQAGGKVLSKLFSRESSAAAPSFRVYYGVASAGSVPFLWESQPGTPKNDAVSKATLPPLTPPPSYYVAKAADSKTSAVAGRKTKQQQQQQARRGFFSAIRPKLVFLHRRAARPSSSPGSSTSSSCSSSSSAFSSSSASSRSTLSFRSAQSPAACASMGRRVYVLSVGEGEEQAPPACFSMRHDSFRGVKMTLRSALASVSSHGATAAAAAAPAEDRV